MAQRVKTTYVSDLSGEEIPEGEVVNVQVGWRGSTYEMDLTSDEAAELDQVLERFIQGARRVGRTRQAGARVQAGGSGRTRQELQAIRAWARENGHAVADTGRVPRGLVEAYDAAPQVM